MNFLNSLFLVVCLYQCTTVCEYTAIQNLEKIRKADAILQIPNDELIFFTLLHHSALHFNPLTTYEIPQKLIPCFVAFI